MGQVVRHSYDFTRDSSEFIFLKCEWMELVFICLEWEKGQVKSKRLRNLVKYH